MSMKVTLVPGRELDADLIRTWAELQRSNPDLASPYFHPEFTRIIAAARGDVEVAVLEDDGNVSAFFPFQRESRTVGKAVGHPLSDYHGVICAPKQKFDPLALLRACKLVAWDFDHVLAAQTPFQPFHQFREISPIIDLSGGLDRYLAERKSYGSGLRIPLQLMRKLEREVGPLTFNVHLKDIELLYFIMRKKSAQYRRSNKPDLFANDWVRKSVENIFQTQTTHFGGMLSTLYAGSEMIAALMSIRSSDVWHAWFLAFEERFSSYSPGFAMYLKIVECGSRLGFRYLDFGKGNQPYKKRLMNGSVALAGGSVELPSWLTFRRSVIRKIRALVTASPLAGPVRRIVRVAGGESKSSEQ